MRYLHQFMREERTLKGRWAIFLVVAVTATGLAIGGCGGDDDGGGAGGDGASAESGSSGDSGSGSDSSEVTTSSLDKAEYVEQANAICRQNTEDRFAALTAYGEENPNAADEANIKDAVNAVILPSMEDLADEIRQLGVPAEGEQQVERIIASFDEVAQAAANSDGELLNPEIAEALKNARTAARTYGLKGCRFK